MHQQCERQKRGNKMNRTEKRSASNARFDTISAVVLSLFPICTALAFGVYSELCCQKTFLIKGRPQTVVVWNREVSQNLRTMPPSWRTLFEKNGKVHKRVVVFFNGNRLPWRAEREVTC